MKSAVLAAGFAIVTELVSVAPMTFYVQTRYKNSDCTGVPKIYKSEIVSEYDNDCPTEPTCSIDEDSGNYAVPEYVGTACVSSLFEDVDHVFSYSPYFLELVYRHNANRGDRYRLYLFDYALAYIADGNCHLFAGSSYQVSIQSDLSVTYSTYASEDCTNTTADSSDIVIVSGDAVRSHEPVDDSGGYIAYYTDSRLPDLSGSTSVGTTNAGSSSRPTTNASVRTTSGTGSTFLISSYYVDSSCRGVPTYADVELTPISDCPTQPTCTAVEHPEYYVVPMYNTRACVSDIFQAVNTLFGQATFFLEVLFQNSSIVYGYALIADGSCHPVHEGSHQVLIQSDGTTNGSFYLHADCANASNARTWNVSGDQVRSHELVATPNGEGFDHIAFYTNRVLSGSSGTSNTTTANTATTNTTTTNTTTSTKTGAAPAGSRSAGTLVVGLAGLLAVVTGAIH